MNFNSNKLTDRMLIYSITVAVMASAVVTVTWALQYVDTFFSDRLLAKSELYSVARQELRQDVENIKRTVEINRISHEKEVIKEIKTRADDGWSIINNIYLQNKGEIPNAQIIKMIKDALRPIRYHHGRGYYYILDERAVDILYSHRPDLEGLDFSKVKDSNGRYVAKDLVRIAREKGEGYYSYTWSKPGVDGYFKKTSYVKYYEPLGIIVGTGEYIEDVRREIKEDILKQFKQYNSKKNTTLFVIDWNGQIVVGPGAPKNLLALKNSDGVEVVKEIIELSKSGGGFIEYKLAIGANQLEELTLSYVVSIDEWEIAIGKGLSLSEIHSAIKERDNYIFDKLLKGLIFVLASLLLAIFVVVIVARYLNSGLIRDIKFLNKFFNEASNNQSIAIDKLKYEEFVWLGEAFNNMVEKRKEAEQTYKVLVENIPDLIIRFNLNYECLFINEVFKKYILNNLNENTEKSLFDLGFDKEFTKTLENALRTSVYTKTIHEVETTAVTRDGSYIVDIRVFPEVDENNSVKSIFCIVRDTTENKLLEEEYRALFNEMIDGFALHEMIYDEKGKPVDYRFLKVNPAFKKLTGLDDSIIGKTVLECLPDTELLWIERYGHVSTTGESLRFEEYAVGLDKYFEVRAFSPKKGFFVSIFQDITRRKQIEEEKEGLRGQLIQSQKMEAIGTLAGGIAHDFNNILAPILGYSELLIYEEEIDKNKVITAITKIKEAANRAKGVVKQILAFSRKSEQQKQPVLIRSLIEEIIRLLRVSIPATIDIEKNINCDAIVNASSDQLHQVFMNICTNAVYSMKEKGGTLTISVESTKSDFFVEEQDFNLNKFVVISIKDTGEGIPPEIIDKVFDPFFTTKPKNEGTGLGLSVVHGIIKEHGGEIKIYSEVGNGTKIDVYLPAEVSDFGEEKQESKLWKGSGNVLLVDDEILVADSMKNMIESMGLSVDFRKSIDTAYELFKENKDKYCLVIVDKTLKRATGYELIGKIREEDRTIPIVLYTGYLDSEDHDKASRFNINVMLEKPVSIFDLSEVLKDLLG